MNINDTEPVPVPMLKTSEYVPSKQEALQYHRIEIEFMSRGGAVSVGCKRIPFETTESMIAELQEYFNNPYETQEKWRKILV